MKKKHIDDIWERALKTFIQAFCGVLVPEIVALLQTGLKPGEVLGAILLPIVCGALAAGISAGWNVINNWLVKSMEEAEEKQDDRDNTK